MITFLGKSYSFGLSCVAFVNFCQFLSVFFPFDYKGSMWDPIISDHFLFFFSYLDKYRNSIPKLSLFRILDIKNGQ